MTSSTPRRDAAGRTDAPPPRPSRREEALSRRLFFALGPRLPRVEQPAPPDGLAPFEAMAVPRGGGRPGVLAATWYPARREPRGAVLFLHPWMEWGKAYFHRRGRLEAVREAGFHALAIDLAGFGGSGARVSFPDRDAEDGLAALAARCPDLPRFVWGVSSGGYWSHPALSAAARTGAPAVRAAFYEDVAAHLIDWSWRTTPAGRPAFGFFRLVFPRSARFLDLRRHAPHLGVAATAYVSGALDRGVPPSDTADLARLGGGRSLVVPGAGHLASIRRAGDEVIALALATFARAFDPID